MWYTGWHASAHERFKASYSRHMFGAAFAALVLTGLGGILSPPYIASPYQLPIEINRTDWIVPDYVVPEEPIDFCPPEEPIALGSLEITDDAPDYQPFYGREIFVPSVMPTVSRPTYTAIQMTKPVIAHQVLAPYPELAQRAGMEGEVIVQVTIDENGRVVHAEVYQSTANVLLESAAIEAARQYLFKPGMQGNVPVRCRAHIRFSFRLDH